MRIKLGGTTSSTSYGDVLFICTERMIVDDVGSKYNHLAVENDKYQNWIEKDISQRAIYQNAHIVL